MGEVLERLVRRIERHLRRCGLLVIDGDEPDGEGDPEGDLAASAVSARRRRPGLSGWRGPPYWKSRVLRRQALGDEDDGQGRWVPQTA